MSARALTLTLMLVFSTFSAVFVPEPTAVLDEPIVPQHAGNTVDCGTNASNVSFEVEAYQPVWNRHDTVSAYLDTYCGVWWNTYRVDWLLVSQDNSSVIDYGQSTFITNNSSVTYHPNHTDHFNEVDVNFHYMETGNYSISGNFYVLANTTWTWLANVSNTFQVNSTDSTTACGYNDTLVSMETDISSNFYFEGASVYPWSDIECPVLGTPYGYSWELFDQNSSAVFQTGWSNFTATWQNVHLFSDGSGIYHDLNLAFHNLTEGVYTLTTVLTLSNGSYVDSANLTLQVWANNSGGGNQTNTGCGYDVNYTMLMAYAAVQMYEGDEFVSWISTYCDLINTSMWIHTYIYDENQTVVANMSMYWTPTTSNGISDNWNVSGLTAGNYTFSATLYAYPGSSVTVETDTVNFTVYPVNNNSGCGYDSNLTAIYAYSWQSIFNVGNMFESTINSYCNLLGSTSMIEWTVYYPSNGTIVAQGNTSWYVNSTSDSLTVNHAGFDEGNYAFLANLSVWDNSASGWNFITDSVYNFSYVASNGNLSSGSLDIDTFNETFAMGDELSASFTSTDLVIGEMYHLDWGLYDESQSMVDGGNSTWMAYTNTSIEWKNYTLDGAPIDYGTYCFYGNLFHVDSNYSATWLTQDDTCITVENPGSNNTGGNNTGGNNTTDSDGDGVEDVLDAFPNDPNEWSDYDNDGVGDNSDNCYWYSNPNQANWDNDTFGDVCDWDDDNDYVNDTDDAFPYDPSEWSDSDSDGVGDNSDNCPNVVNTDQSDTNNNGIGDACDSNTGGTGNNTGGGNNTVINTPPVISGVTISPNMPQSDDNLTCTYTTFDAEGDTVTTTVVWNVNGNTIASGTDTISTGYGVGDEVQCVVSGSDGQAPGNTDSDTVTILPTVSDVEGGAGNGLPALGSVGTLLAIAIGVGLTRRQDD
jgi:hypothetical protein